MSGPKTSRYTLTPEQRRRLAEERRIYEERQRKLAIQREMNRRKAAASEKIKKGSERIRQIGSMFSYEKRVAAERMSHMGDDGGFAQRVNELELLIAPVAPAVAGTDSDDVPALEKAAREISECVVRAEEMIREISYIAAQNAARLQAHIDDAIDQGFAALPAETKPPVSGSEGSVRDRMREQLLQMEKSDSLPADWLEEIRDTISKMNEIQGEEFLKNFSALTVSPLIRKCKSFLAEYEECHEEFEKLYFEYTALCELYCYTAQECPCTAASVAFLKTEIQRITEAAGEEDEQAYISECLDEVMEEMGYAVLGHRQVTKKSGKHFQNKLYIYGEGTAVSVTCSPDGKVAMELGGLDGEDRLPDERETSLLCDSMESFCDDFKEIERRLLAKGVILADRISMLPPEAEYAQIINTSDYELEAEAERFEAERFEAGRQRKTRRVGLMQKRGDMNGEI